jgi:hypothetical protein
MTGIKAVAGAVLLSVVVLAPVCAQSFSEPAAFQAQHPDRDVLNGGALTPWGAAARGLARQGGPLNAMGRTGSSACERYRTSDPASGTFLGRGGRRHPCS